MFTDLVVFSLDDQQFALTLPVVQRVYRAVEITPLPNAPEVVLGVVNVHGAIVPVMSLRRRFQLPEREVDPGDEMILATTPKRTVALLVNSVEGVVQVPDRAIVEAEKILPDLPYLKGVARLGDGIVLIYDLEEFLSLEEERVLTRALLQG